MNQDPQKKNQWKATTIVLLVIVIGMGAAIAALVLNLNREQEKYSLAAKDHETTKQQLAKVSSNSSSQKSPTCPVATKTENKACNFDSEITGLNAAYRKEYKDKFIIYFPEKKGFFLKTSANGKYVIARPAINWLIDNGPKAWKSLGNETISNLFYRKVDSKEWKMATMPSSGPWDARLDAEAKEAFKGVDLSVN